MQKEDVNYIPFSTVASWGASNNLFVIYIDRGCADTEKIYFETFQTKVIEILVQSYCYLMSGKSINEILIDNNNVSRRLESIPVSFSTGVSTRSKSASSFKK
jgi:hypothetical protein